MALLGLIKFALLCIDFLAWPVIALGYPLFASIRAIETDSKYHMKKLVIYWTLFALISLFEFAFAKIIEWIPSWSSIKLIAICCLVMPRFDGACFAYQDLVRPCLSVNPQAVIERFYKAKKKKPHELETFLDVAEKYIKENGSEAMEKLIASKLEPKEPDSSQRVTKVQEPEEKNAAATSEELKGPDTAQKDKEMLLAVEKSATTEAKQVKHAEVKEMIPPEASATSRQPETTPLKKVQPEWICTLCQVTTTSEKTLNAHLQGNKHKSQCEYLKSKLYAKNTGISKEASSKVAEVKVGEASEQSEAKQVQNDEVKEITPPEESSRNRHPETPPVKKVRPPEWTCGLCQVTTTSEKTLNAHLQGNKHRSKYELLKSQLYPKETGSSNSAKGKVGEASEQDGASTQKFELHCHFCNAKLRNEIDLVSHLQGKRHLSNIKIIDEN